ncbi:MAG: hypothetical protein RMM58_03340 [Chloroflexota bacterium]|nr:hypothetical protein [Dehalococcoidia bacterium]MDW8252893.1 hypothetical protein [Chloroflexota bacterium]
MSLQFRRGSPDRPRGHAIVYFEVTEQPGSIVATYVVLSPIVFDIVKYLPPMFAGGVDLSQLGGSFVALPPIPERVESIALLERLAELRDDDLVDGGRVGSTLDRQMQATAEAVHAYQRLYDAGTKPLAAEPPAAPLDVDDVVYELMTDQVRVSELAKLTGKLRYAVETGDRHLLEETIGEVRRIGRYLPPSYRVEAFLRAATSSRPEAGKLTQLYLERCYKLAAEEYGDVARLDREIREFEAEHAT